MSILVLHTAAAILAMLCSFCIIFGIMEAVAKDSDDWAGINSVTVSLPSGVDVDTETR